MTKPTLAKLNFKAAWLKKLRTGEEDSIWRAGAEIIDSEMKSARKLLAKAGMPYTVRGQTRHRSTMLSLTNPGIMAYSPCATSATLCFSCCTKVAI